LKNRLLLTYGGGLFSIDPTLIGLIRSLISIEEKTFIFVDNNDIPIMIDNLQDFEEKVISKYRDALESYYKNYQKLNEAREIRKVINWDDKVKKE